MSWKLKGKVEGLQGIVGLLKDAEKKLQKKLLRKAVSEAGNVVKRRVKQLAPVELRLYLKSLGKKVKVYRNTGTAVAIVGPRKGFRTQVLRKKGKWAPAPPPPSGYADPVKYAHLVEGGAKAHAEKGGVRHPLKRSIEGQQAQIRDAMAAVIKAGLGI